ncbi:MAG: NifU family protein [Alphaproteobacteria bacterium]|jgi:Fe-S cluster biogenesis protein NfuA|nr:NifU family protein [Alphaproteobacteria bacterium]
MFIQTEDTPNPASLKFLPGREVTGSAPPVDFPNQDAAEASPLAAALFAIEGVSSVFFGADYIVVSKADALEWQVVKPAILTAIMEHFIAERPLMAAGFTGGPADEAQIAEEDTEVVAMIKQILDTRVRPAVAQDGGDIVFHGFEDGIVSLHMRGACAGCPSATATLKQGVENLLKHYVPSVSEVRAVI